MKKLTGSGAAPGMLPKHDLGTRLLHAALAMAVVAELALLSVMRVPAGPGLGVRDWHREAFEIHCRIGPAVALIWAAHWLWICLPVARPGVGYLFPWWRREGRAAVRRELENLLHLKLPAADELSPLVGTVQGLGLCAVSGSVVGGMISYAGYFMGVPISGRVLHEVAWEQLVMSWLVWAFVIGHGLMALRHLLLRGTRARQTRAGAI
jgi:cytochrome b561